ncbi:cell division protein SepF [Thermoproteota archaeon]
MAKKGAFYKLKLFFGFVEEEPEEDIIQKAVDERTPSIKPSFKGALINSQNAHRLTPSEIKIEEPRIYEDSLNISTYLRDNIPVIVNLKYLDSDSGKRLIDFICGTAYAINGHMMKIGENIFLFTPANVLIVESGERTAFERGLAQDQKEVFFKRANG